MATSVIKRDSEPGRTSRLRWHRVVATAASILILILVVAAGVLVSTQKIEVDFLSYWAAGKMALAGDAALAYDFKAHHAVQETAVPFDGVLPFPYPPPFLFVVMPFGAVPYGVATAIWILFTGGLFYASVRHLTPKPYRMAHPSVLANGLIGQNGFLTSAIFICGFRLMQARPLLSGAVLGLFVFKPQLALLFPIAVIAARRWRTIAGAALSASGLLLAALIAFGPEAYQAFFRTVPQYASYMQEERWPWVELASPFALLRWFSVLETVALTVQGIIAIAAAWVVWRAWRADRPEAVPILAASTMLVSPYLLTYDALLLVVPLAWLIREERSPALIAIIWLCCLLPVASYFGYYHGPNTIPIASILCLIALSDQPSGPKVRVEQQ